jgi:hypothetical protein
MATFQLASAASQRVTTLASSLKDNLTAHLASATGFITFKTRRAQVSAAQVPILSQQYPKVLASQAPAPSDIIWANMSVTTEHTENVAYATSIFYYIGTFFDFYSKFFLCICYTTYIRY